jgi:glycerol-3-phosphate acyltransferase PlsY
MTVTAWFVVLPVAASYVVGSIPWAYIAGRVIKGVDLRKFGSGNLGTTNVLRLLGRPAAVTVYVLDAMKGVVPVTVFPIVFGFVHRGVLAIACGVAAILGHVRPIFLLWHGGGKGVATASGVFLGLTPIATIIALTGFLIVMFTTRIMSLASLTGAAIIPVAVGVIDGWRSPVFGASVVVAGFVGWMHRANIGRLRRGEEPRLGRLGPTP